MRNVITLSIAQAFAASGLTVVVLMGGLVGAEIGPGPAWATAPVSIAIVAVALTTIPASMLMSRIGRRAGFMIGALIGVIGGGVAAFGVVKENFWVFCGGSMLLGATMAFTQQYRFAAAESVAAGQMSRAVSSVLVGSLCAAVIGPRAALAARSAIEDALYAGSYLAVGALYLAAIAVLVFYRGPKPSHASASSAPMPIGQLLQHTQYRTAVFASVVGYAVMSFIMTAAPVSMHHAAHDIEAVTWVIQSHVLAMFLPSLVSGRIVARFGERRVMLWGAALSGLCAAMSLLGAQVAHYWWSLVLLGVGWNLLFVSGTTLLTRSFPGPERHRAQALNEFTVFGSQACASLLAGFAVQAVGWRALNLATLPLLATLVIAANRLKAPAAAATDAAEAAR